MTRASDIDQELSHALALSRRLIQSAEYYAQAMRREVASLEENANVTQLDVLRTRGFVFAFAGQDEAARHDLEAVVSQESGRTAKVLNKLAQVLVRIGGKDNLERAAELGEMAGGLAENSDEKWHSLHNVALAKLGLGDDRSATKFAEQALAVRHDVRTNAVLAAAMRTNRESELVSSMVARGLLVDLELDGTTEELRRRLDTIAVSSVEPMA